jgi:hypothetical protein
MVAFDTCLINADLPVCGKMTGGAIKFPSPDPMIDLFD